MKEFILSQNDVQETVQVGRQGNEIHVEMGGKKTIFQLISQTEDSLLLARTLADGSRQQWRLVGHRDGTKRMLWLNGRTHQYERVLPRGGGAASLDVSLSATIPAVVADILVGVGDQVQDGDKLILLESMKMVIPIQAPYSGIVTAIKCQKGESVQAGTPLIELDEI